MNRPSFETLGLAAALTLAGCKGCEGEVNLPEDGVVDTDTSTDTDTSVDTATGSGTDSGVETDTADTSTGTDSGMDTGTGIAVVTTFTQATCEALADTLMPNDLSDTQFVESLGAAATYTGRTFQDTRFDATLDEEVVGACLYNGEGTAADETRVTRVPATETDPATLTVEGEIDMSGGALLMQFVTPEALWAAQNAEDTNPAWIYVAEAGEVTDTQY